MSSLSHDDILEQIKKTDDEIKLRIEYYETIINAILKKKESVERAKIVWSTVLSFVPSEGELPIDREDITERFNSCNQWLSESEIILPSIKSARDKELSDLTISRVKLVDLLDK
jgi:hypothetical protein